MDIFLFSIKDFQMEAKKMSFHIDYSLKKTHTILCPKEKEPPVL